MKDDFFIRITKITDNLGNDLIDQRTPYPVLKVGDEYEITVEANDPKGRKIQYRLYNSKGMDIIQDSNRFNFTIENKLIGATSIFTVYAMTPDSEYENQVLKSVLTTILPRKS